MKEIFTNDVIKTLSPYLDLEKGPWLAGGFLHRIVAGLPTNTCDIDIFFSDQKQCDNFKHHTTNLPFKLRIQPVQKFMFVSAQSVIDDFDFTVVQLVTDGKNIIYGDKTIEDIKNKRLELNPKSEIRALHRMAKYVSMGYLPSPDALKQSIEKHSVNSNYYLPATVASFPSKTYAIDNRIKTLNKLFDVICYEGDDGLPVVFIRGYPMPLQMAYLMILSHQMNSLISGKLYTDISKTWKAMNLPIHVDKWVWQKEILNDITLEKLLNAYSDMSSTISTTCPSPTISSTTCTNASTEVESSIFPLVSLSFTSLLILKTNISSLILAILKLRV